MHASAVREGPLVDAVHPVRPAARLRQDITLRQPDTGRWPTADEPDATASASSSSRCGRCGTTTSDVYVFHTHFLNGSTHTYASKPPGWLLLNRPVGVDAPTPASSPARRAATRRTGSDCLRQVLLLGTPALWWGGASRCSSRSCCWVGARDWRFGVAVVGALSTWLPWLPYDDRPIFSFYAIITLPFMVLAITLLLGRMLGTSTRADPAAHGRGGRRRRRSSCW